MGDAIVNVLHWLFPETSNAGLGDYAFMVGGALSWLASVFRWNRGWPWRYAPVFYFAIFGGILSLFTMPPASVGDAAARVAVWTGIGWFAWTLAFLLVTKQLSKSSILASQYPSPATTADVASLIERHLDGPIGEWEWDNFISCSDPDETLERIRVRCAGLPKEYPPRHRWEYTNPEGVAVLRQMVSDLRADDGQAR